MHNNWRSSLIYAIAKRVKPSNYALVYDYCHNRPNGKNIGRSTGSEGAFLRVLDGYGKNTIEINILNKLYYDLGLSNVNPSRSPRSPTVIVIYYFSEENVSFQLFVT